jgi:glycosyltransferase involved in cell wall biosynthesis
MYIAFIDDDDWCEPDFLEFLNNLAVESSADVSICGSTGNMLEEKTIYSAEEAVIALLWRKRFNVQFPTKLIRSKIFDGVRFSESAKYDDIELMPKILASANRVAFHGSPKYTFNRHEGNNSAWTTNHSLLTTETLDEYLRVYRERTEWLSERFPNSAAAWRYFEWSFMISMIEKITRLGIKDCERQLGTMRRELRENADEFLNSDMTLDFERDWMAEYIEQ